MAKHPKRPRDANQLGKLIVHLSVGEATDPPDSIESYAAQFARKGGLKGGKARAEALSPRRRKMIARKAANARWGNGK
jgi:hypothetical protein